MPSNNAQLIHIDDVKAQVETYIKKKFTWFYSQTTGSTNSDLLQHNQPLSIAITESQNQGRGQRDNTWHSSHAENLLFSIALSANPNLNLALMPIKVGIAVKNALNQLKFDDITLKWPNDIFYRNKKLGGILIESITQDNQVLMIIGVGLNVNMAYSNKDNFIALKQNTNINRTPLLIACIKAIIESTLNNDNDTVNAFNNAHLFHQKPIQFKQGSHIKLGVCQGINTHGQLVLKMPHGIETLSTGSIIMDHHAVS